LISSVKINFFSVISVLFLSVRDGLCRSWSNFKLLMLPKVALIFANQSDKLVDRGMHGPADRRYDYSG